MSAASYAPTEEVTLGINETQLPFLRLADSHAASCDDPALLPPARSCDGDLLTLGQIGSIFAACDAECLAQHGRSPSQSPDIFLPPGYHHLFDSPNGFYGANQHGTPDSRAFGHGIETVLGVNGIDVKRPRRIKHRCVAGRQTTRAMAGGIPARQIRFRFNNPTPKPLSADATQESHADQRSRNILSFGLIKFDWQSFVATFHHLHQPMEQIYRARWILPITSPPIHGGWVHLRGQRVIGFGSGKPPGVSLDGSVQDLGDVALMPGLVNAHTHLEFSDLRQPIGSPGMRLADWIGEVVQTRSVATEFERQQRILDGWTQSRDAGVALIGEISTPPCRYDASRGHYDASGSLPELISFAEILGLSSERGGERYAAAEAHLRDVSFGAISPHAPYSTPWSLIDRSVQLASRYGVPLAMHVAESPDERELIHQGAGPFAEALKAIGVWDEKLFPWPAGRNYETLIELLARAPRALLIHGNDLKTPEIKKLQIHPNVTVVYCPRTHHFFGYPPHPVGDLLQAGVNVALGTDSRASNPDLSLWREVQFLLRHRTDLSPDNILEMATVRGADALGRSEFGRIADGSRASLAIVPTTASDAGKLARDFAENELLPVCNPGTTGP